MPRFRDRRHAGRLLADRLAPLRGQIDLVLGLPRGGVPVATEVADRLGCPLDVILVRKLGVPYQPELAMGAIGEGGIRIMNDHVVRLCGVTPAEIARVEEVERSTLEERARRYRRGPRRELHGKRVIVIDDGIATGATLKAACEVARGEGAARIIAAAPVATPDVMTKLGAAADEVICLATPPDFAAIGQFYDDFSQTSDSEVIELLDRYRQPAPANTASEVLIPAGGRRLPGRLIVPPEATTIVVFAHGSGSSRHSPRNLYVAETLRAAGLGTLLFDLLDETEAIDRTNVFDIPLLAGRLTDSVRWLIGQPVTKNLSIAYFGASTGAAAALWSAAEQKVAAVVSRGGRPDLAAARLQDVTAPSLLIVGGEDHLVWELNRTALKSLPSGSRLEVVPGAGHLFEEPGALEKVAELAVDWFTSHSGRPPGGTPRPITA